MGSFNILDNNSVKVRAILFLSILFVGSWIQYLYGIGLCVFFGYSYPYTSPLFLPEDRFMDFFNPAFFCEPGGIASYSAFALLVGKFFQNIVDWTSGRYEAVYTVSGALSYLFVVLAYLWCLLTLANKVQKQTFQFDSPIALLATVGVFFILGTCYPSLFLLDRGNYILLVFVCMFLFFEYREKPYLACLFLASAISIKQYFGLILYYFLLKREFRLFLMTSIIIAVLNSVSSTLLANDIHSFREYFFAFYRPEIYDSWGLHQKVEWHSQLINLFYLFILPVPYFFLGGSAVSQVAWWVDKIYLYAVFLPCVLIVPYLISRKTDDFREAFLYLILTIILLLPFIGNYSLVYLLLLVPFIINERNKINMTSLMLIGGLLIPKVYFSLLESETSRFTLQPFLNPVLIISLLYMFLMRKKTDDQSNESLLGQR